MHPSKDLLELHSNMLSGKKIVLGITGSIAAVESVKLIHELIRHGAIVHPVMTKAATEIISPDAIFYASGNRPIVKLTGAVEHVELCGDVKDKADLLLIVPCTANTISKIAHGIDDTTVTTCATTAIGSKMPIIIVPAMHGSMYEHPIVQDNIKKLRDGRLNIEFIDPLKSEKKYKLPTLDEVVSRVIRKLWKNDLNKKRVLVIAGATSEEVDHMRVLTNKSSGATGVAIARLAFYRGGEVDLWLGTANVNVDIIKFIKSERFQTVEDLQKKVAKLKAHGKKNYDIIILCAAISDYTIPAKEKFNGKIPSGKKYLNLRLIPTQKIIKLVKTQCPNSFIVGFKAESNQTERNLIKKAKTRLNQWDIDMIVANDLSKVKEETSEVIIIKKDKDPIKVKGHKEKIADVLLDVIIG